MIRRNFLKFFGLGSFFGISKIQANEDVIVNENPKNLPVVEFNEKGRVSNLEEILKPFDLPVIDVNSIYNKKGLIGIDILVFVREEYKIFMHGSFYNVHFGEMRMLIYCITSISTTSKKTFNVEFYDVENTKTHKMIAPYQTLREEEVFNANNA